MPVLLERIVEAVAVTLAVRFVERLLDEPRVLTTQPSNEGPGSAPSGRPGRAGSGTVPLSA